MTNPPVTSQHLILIGLRGSGKSTIARALSERENRQCFDLDNLTPAELGCASVSEAWATHGEPAFRAAERAALERLLGDLDRTDCTSGAVIALGGGTPTAPGVSELLRDLRQKRRAVVVYLRETPEVLCTRLSRDTLAQRPSLTGAHPLDEIGAVYAARDPLYRSLASREVSGLETLEDALRAFAGWQEW